MGLRSEQRYQKRVAAVSAVQRGESPKVVARVMNIPLNTLYVSDLKTDPYFALFKSQGRMQIFEPKSVQVCGPSHPAFAVHFG